MLIINQIKNNLKPEIFISLLSLVLILPSCTPGIKHPNIPKMPPNISDTLSEYLIGDYSSKEQSIADSDYFDIRLHIKRVWEDKPGGHWLYVEQAVASAQDKPYRQRIYHIFPNFPKCISEVYTIKDDKKFIGLWKNKDLEKDLTFASLDRKNGCEVILDFKNGKFIGGTNGNECSSELKGAKYAKSEVSIGLDDMITWDRGYNSAGEQVWGAVKGGYIFMKNENQQK